MRVSATTVAKVLPQASVSPAGARAQLSWRGVLRAQADIFLVINPALCAATIAFIVVYSI